MATLVRLLVLVLFAACSGSPPAPLRVQPMRADASTDADATFPIGVWLQDPVHEIAGHTTAWHYRQMGVTHWMGIYEWPSEANRYPGFNQHAAQALAAEGLVCYAGNDQAAVDWIQNNPTLAAPFIGYLVGDEPDMVRTQFAWAHPDTWLQTCKTLAEEDPDRGLYANFGKGFGKIPWVGLQPFPGPTLQDDHDKYTALLSIASVDAYGLTDGYEMPVDVGVWCYGRNVRNARYWIEHGPNPTCPVWGFAECGCPFPNNNGLYPAMPIELIAPTAWIQVCAGADGLIWFPQDFYEGLPESGNYPIEHPEVGLVVQATNASIQFYAPVLATPQITSTTVSTTGVEVIVRTHDWGGARYLFAIGSGDTSHIHGQAVTATIGVPGISATSADVLGEGRTVPLTGGTFVDSFGAYQLHVYRIAL